MKKTVITNGNVPTQTWSRRSSPRQIQTPHHHRSSLHSPGQMEMMMMMVMGANSKIIITIIISIINTSIQGIWNLAMLQNVKRDFFKEADIGALLINTAKLHYVQLKPYSFRDE